MIYIQIILAMIYLQIILMLSWLMGILWSFKWINIIIFCSPIVLLLSKAIRIALHKLTLFLFLIWSSLFYFMSLIIQYITKAKVYFQFTHIFEIIFAFYSMNLSISVSNLNYFLLLMSLIFWLSTRKALFLIFY